MAEEPEDKVKVELEVPLDKVSFLKSSELEKKERDLYKKAEEVEKKEKEADKKLERAKKIASGKEEDEDDSEFTILGYKPDEILKAPTGETPEPVSKEPATRPQLVVIIIGLAIVILGFLSWIFLPFFAGLTIAILGGIVIAVGTLVRIT